MNNVNKKLDELEKIYSRNEEPLRFNFREYVTTDLHVKRSDVYTHNIHSYPGRLFPYIPILFLSTDKYCSANGKILDPFSGSGTVLLESLVNPYYKRDAYGVEINPLGRLISKVKTTPIAPDMLDKKIKSLFDISKKRRSKSIPSFKNIDLWYSNKAKEGLGRLKAAIEHLDDDNYKDFLWVCFSKLARDVSKADPVIPPPVILKIEKYRGSYRYDKLKALMHRNENPDIESIFRKILYDNVERVKRLWELKELRDGKVTAKIICDDSRNIKKGSYILKGEVEKKGSRSINNSISMIITSPPYLTAQKYVRATKLELYWLEMVDSEEFNYLRRQTIGTENTPLRTNVHDLGVASIDEQIKNIGKMSRERMVLTFDYFKNMMQVFEQSYNVLKTDGYMILVVGNNQVGELTINTAKLLSDLAKKVGFEETLMLCDEIKGRGMITKRHGTGGLIKDEYVIVLRKA